MSKYRVVGRVEPEENNGLGVSTCWVQEYKKFETAILDRNGAWPVQRYKKFDKAISGHREWVVFARKEGELKINSLDGERVVLERADLIN